MVSNGDNWVRIFDIPDTSKHRKGFTVYKVISMLYPANCPDAVTKITVWKRFNDFKKLYRDMKILHHKLDIKDRFPSLPSSSFFKRFDEETVKARKENILSFLEYVASHSQLFTSTEFVKFFETSQSPHSNSNINSIRADLNLPEEEFVPSDDEHTVSDTDSMTTSSDILSNGKSRRRNCDSVSISTTTDSINLLDGLIYPTPPNTPHENTAQYIIDASMHVGIAMELENDKKYEEAFAAYKTAIDILIKYGKDDKDYDRKQIVRYKTDKYLIRAEKIYNMYLASEVQTLRKIKETEETHAECVHRPISDLYKYKVVRIIGSGMLALHAELQQLFYIKVIHKTVQFLNENLILPENVPYMVKLHNYHNCENALFLVLEYCSGKPLWDYIKSRSQNPDDLFYLSNQQLLRQMRDMELSDPESEQSFSDLINDYTKTKTQNNEVLSSDESYEKVDIEASNRNLMDLPLPSTVVKVKENDDDDLGIEETFLVPKETVVKWAAQLLLSLEKLHTLGVTCYDLQSHNLLIDEHGDLILTYMCNVNKVCDVFSTANLKHVPPELYTFGPMTSAVDWWCFGAILYELLVGMPLSCVHPDGLSCGISLKIPKYVSAEGRSLLRQVLASDPQNRLGPESLKSHPFFHQVSWEMLLAKYNC